MGGDNLGQIHIAQNRRVCHHNILVFVIGAVLQKVHSKVQIFQLPPIAVGGGHGIGCQKFQTTLPQLQAPFFRITHMVHQGLVVMAGDDADMPDPGAGHIGQVEIDLAVASAERKACHGTLGSQIAHGCIISENNTHYIHC